MNPSSVRRTLFFLFTSFFVLSVSYSQVTIVSYNSSWKYLDIDTRPAGWETSAFNDAAWSSGNGQLGYGDGDETTVVQCSACNPKYITTYFRKTINITDPTVYSSFTLNVRRDDGVVVYINGTERYRNNMPAGAPAHSTLASAAAADDGNTPQSTSLSTAFFSAGNNVIAVEIHQNSTTSSDITFDLELLGIDAFSSTLTRGPYLQMGNQTGITIRWRTSAAQDSRVELGTTYGTYPTVVSDATSTTEHIVTVTGLSADTKYWYRIGNSTNMGAPDADKFFTSAPLANTTRKIRIAAFGDCGRNSATYQDQTLTNYRSYLSTNSIDAPDAWILLGDNAYTTGTDAEYTSNFFGIYGSNILKNHKLYPAPGNHDYGNNAANKTLRNMAYHTNFTTPAAAECGGVASGVENFYSFDIGNIHFLSLDSWGIEADGSYMGRDTNLVHTQLTWIKNDLAANTKKWVIAYWHHPPYTMGSHNSDSEGELVNVRQMFIKSLEDRGVDMIITGHSHDYERSYLLKGHFGNEASFVLGTHAVSSSNAFYNSAITCPYVYNSTPLNHGTVYVVAGSVGASGGTQAGYPHNALPFAVNDAGILYFEVEDNRLDAKMLRRDGTIFDQFTIMKDVNLNQSYNIVNGSSITLDASWPSGNYTWSTSATTRSVTVTPPSNNTTIYTVTDNFGCVTDQYSVTTTTTLPVHLLDYTVVLNRDKVNINWSTAIESSSSHFIVERTLDGRNFEEVGRINAAGNSTVTRHYSLVDNNPALGISYYRLAQVDIDNTVKHYELKKIVYASGKNIYVKQLNDLNGTLSLQINSSKTDKLKLQVFDVTGKTIWVEDFRITQGISSKRVSLKPGAYIWKINNTGGETVTGKTYIK